MKICWHGNFLKVDDKPELYTIKEACLTFADYAEDILAFVKETKIHLYEKTLGIERKLEETAVAAADWWANKLLDPNTTVYVRSEGYMPSDLNMAEACQDSFFYIQVKNFHEYLTYLIDTELKTKGVVTLKLDSEFKGLLKTAADDAFIKSRNEEIGDFSIDVRYRTDLDISMTVTKDTITLSEDPNKEEEKIFPSIEIKKDKLKFCCMLLVYII